MDEGTRVSGCATSPVGYLHDGKSAFVHGRGTLYGYPGAAGQAPTPILCLQISLSLMPL